MKYNIFNISLLLLIILASSCGKYLDKKPDVALATLTTLDDFNAFLDDYSTMNVSMHPFGDIMSDSYYMTTSSWQSMGDYFRETYKWNKVDIPQDQVWKYRPILYANIVLEESKDAANEGQQDLYNQIVGKALFFRAFHHFSLAQVFSSPYNKATSSTDIGIPLKLTSDYNEVSTRATVEQTYAQIIKDLKESVPLLPATSLLKTRPSQAAAYGTLARLYLSIEEYDSAWTYADKSLYIHDSLMDFNVPNGIDYIGASASAPIKRFNREVIFHARSGGVTPLVTTRAKIDSNLYKSYDVNDWRKTVFYRANTGANAGTYAFKGDYDGSGTNANFSYTGIVTDELYLIRAECSARRGLIPEALSDLNALLVKRIKTDFFQPIDIVDQQQLIDTILNERYKELFFRSTRWIDIRRLSKDPQRAIIPKRVIDGEVFELHPNSSRYTLQIPSSVIQLSGMPQNP